MLKNFIVLFVSTLLIAKSAFAFQYGDPSADEQAHLEAINRARLAPQNEASRLNIDLFEGVPEGEISDSPVQPLSFNASLTETARSHSQDILFRNFFAHNNPDGESPFDRILAGGYLYRSAGENIAIFGTTEFLDQQQTALKLHDNLFVDTDYPDRGHRVNILVPDFREIGVGLASGDWRQDDTIFNAQVVTTNFGLRQDNLPILLGVVYRDDNQDQTYNAGEGIADITIDILQTPDATISASAGGYGLELMDGNYLVAYTHETLGTVAKPLQIGNQNIKIDTLLSEFTDPNSISQCATLIQEQLLIPCVVANGEQYIAHLNLSSTSPTTFNIQHIKAYQLPQTSQCANYEEQTRIVHFPCLNIEKQRYWADFKLPISRPDSIELLDYGLL